MQIEVTPDRLWGKAELAAFCGVSERTIDRARASGKLRTTWLEGVLRFRQQDVDEYLSRRTSRR